MYELPIDIHAHFGENIVRNLVEKTTEYRSALEDYIKFVAEPLKVRKVVMMSYPQENGILYCPFLPNSPHKFSMKHIPCAVKERPLTLKCPACGYEWEITYDPYFAQNIKAAQTLKAEIEKLKPRLKVYFAPYIFPDVYEEPSSFAEFFKKLVGIFRGLGFEKIPYVKYYPISHFDRRLPEFLVEVEKLCKSSDDTHRNK